MKMKSPSKKSNSPDANAELKNRPLRSVDEILEEKFEQRTPAGGDVDHGDEVTGMDDKGSSERKDLAKPREFRDEEKEGFVSGTGSGKEQMEKDTPGGIPGEELPGIEKNDREPVSAKEVL
jgi:hypothetical protein